MRTLLIFLLAVLFSLCSNAQEQQGGLIGKFKERNEVGYQKPLSLQKSCIERHVKARKNAYLFGFAGTTVISITALSQSEKPAPFYVIGGVCLVASFVNVISSEKWLKKHAIEISNSGIVKRF